MTKILYVEDNEDNIFMLTRRLSRKGYEVSVAKDGEEGIENALSEQPDLILMDVMLPLLDGLEATRKLKSLPGTREMPIIAVSSRAMSGDRDKALAAGCDDYHTKPIQFERLLEAISAHLPDHDGN